MIYEMHLQEGPFNKILSGAKIFELRLNDEKRQKLKIGDIIRFTKINDELDNCLSVQILGLNKYESFKKLYEADSDKDDELTLKKCGSKEDVSLEDFLKRMGEFYSKEDEEKYGVLAIKIKIIQYSEITR